MNRVTKRTWLVSLFLVLLLGGMGMFLLEYFTQATEWISMAGSNHSGNTNLVNGTVVDRWGSVLLDVSGSGRTYSADVQTRKSTLHWLGDPGGNIRARILSNYSGPMTGYDVVNGVYKGTGSGGVAVFTLSAKIQNAALTALSGRKGTVAVYNYRTGEILCAVSSPTFDPNNIPDIAGDTTGAYAGVYLNRFMQSSYTPGSIYKVITTAAALDTIPAIEDATFYCSGKYAYGKEAVTCEGAHGWVDLKGALAHSCNCAFAQIAEAVGRKNMTGYVRQFQITEPVRFDGISTVTGHYDISDAGAASFAWSAIGQHSDLINPCRYMTFMGQIAGGGKAAIPHIVSQVVCGDQVTYQAEPVMSERIMSEELAKRLQDYMHNAVEVSYGSWQFSGMTVCAKSGTAQLSAGQQPNAMFTGFVTNPEYPLAFIVVVENGGYGAAVALPISADVLKVCKTVLDAER